jgi:hypothetical protein
LIRNRFAPGKAVLVLMVPNILDGCPPVTRPRMFPMDIPVVFWNTAVSFVPTVKEPKL